MTATRYAIDEAADWATATLKDNTTGTTATLLAKTCVSSSGWTQVSAALTAGHSYTLTLTSHDDNYPADPTYAAQADGLPTPSIPRATRCAGPPAGVPAGLVSRRSLGKAP